MSRSGTDQLWLVLFAIAIVCGSATAARAGQLAALVSPGALSRAHAALDGAGNCAKCHEAGRKVAADRCLVCHTPIADRIAKKLGVHRSVTTDCVSCHSEHAGADADLRRIDTRTFNHQAEAGFPLDGLHAKTAATCTSCHKSRSMLNAKPACASCHVDAHKGNLGADCVRCHSTKVAFKTTASQFNHATARFALTGAHQTVACAKCHTRPDAFRGLAFDACTSCHVAPHRKTLGPSCTTCHTTERWATRTVDHSKTAFPLAGLHAQVACAKCHQAGITKSLRFDQCSACHVNVHKASIKDDCRSCHTVTGFKGAPFDHAVRAGFALDGKHAGVTCAKCHTSVSAAAIPLARKAADYSGASRDCAACHTDTHKGSYGRACDSCHRPAGFDVSHFAHPRTPEFFGDRHAGVTCVKCHAPREPARTVISPSMTCASCHADVHLGQVSTACERCHSVAGDHFTAVRFAHDASPFPLTGKHAAVACATCHRTETRLFPSGAGTAMHFRTGTECRTCHTDPHLGQVDARCETCHSTTTFKVTAYIHRGLEDFFAGFHGKYACRSCHKNETGTFPAGTGKAVKFTVGRTCAACHPRF
jgi:hypothetical protein